MSENTLRNSMELPMPAWFKLAATFCVASWLSFLDKSVWLPRSYFEMPYIVYQALVGGLVIFSSVFLIIVFLFPRSKLSVAFYWGVGAARQYIIILAAWALVFYALKLPFITFTGRFVHFQFDLLRSPHGLIPFLNITAFMVGAYFVEDRQQNGFPLKLFERVSHFKHRITSAIYNIPRWAAVILAAGLPILVVCCVIYFIFGAKLSDYRPYMWNDATSYWSWIRSFSSYGFNVGYNVADENIAPAVFNHYGEGSPLFIYLYGFIGQMVGWSAQLPILINFAILASAIVLFTSSLKFDSQQIIYTGLVSLFFWPVILLLPTTSHETVNQALSFGIAAITYVLLVKKDHSLWLKACYVLVVFIASLVRLSWGLLLFPIIFLCMQGKLLRRAIFSIGLGAILFVGSMRITQYLVPPGNNSIFSTVGGVASADGLSAVFIHFIIQIRDLFKFNELNPNLAIVFELFVLLGWSLLGLWQLARKKLPLENILQTRTVFDIYNMSILFIGGMTVYLADGFYRIFVPPMLVSVLVQIAQKEYKFIKIFLVLNLLFAPIFINYLWNYPALQADYTTRIPEIAKSRVELEKYLVFDKDVKNSWCNTVLIPLGFYDYRVTIIPPGIGVSYILTSQIYTQKLKSKFLLLDGESYQKFIQTNNLNAELLATLKTGNLYYNRDSGCEIIRQGSSPSGYDITTRVLQPFVLPSN